MTQLGKSHLEIFILAGLEAEAVCERVTRLGKSHLEIFILAGSEVEAVCERVTRLGIVRYSFWRGRKRKRKWRARVESDAAR